MFGKSKDNSEVREVRFETKDMKADGPVLCYIITDKETGVQYLYTWGGNGGGVTPLLDENGNVSIKK